MTYHHGETCLKQPQRSPMRDVEIHLGDGIVMLTLPCLKSLYDAVWPTQNPVMRPHVQA